MLTELEKQMVFFIDGSPLTLGGAGHPSVQTKVRTLAKLKNWVDLAKRVIVAEFPAHNLTTAFGVFNVRAAGSPNEVSSLKRIAHFLGMDAGVLRTEFDDHRHVAKAIVAKEGVSTIEAWRRAVAATQADARRKRRHPVSVLLPALLRFGAYMFTTAGVEQGFSRFKEAINDHRGCLAEDGINNDLMLVLDIDDSQTDELCKLAQLEWAAVYGDARTAHRAPRLDSGKPRPTTGPLVPLGYCLDTPLDAVSLEPNSQVFPTDAVSLEPVWCLFILEPM